MDCTRTRERRFGKELSYKVVDSGKAAWYSSGINSGLIQRSWDRPTTPTLFDLK